MYHSCSESEVIYIAVGIADIAEVVVADNTRRVDLPSVVGAVHIRRVEKQFP